MELLELYNSLQSNRWVDVDVNVNAAVHKTILLLDFKYFSKTQKQKRTTSNEGIIGSSLIIKSKNNGQRSKLTRQNKKIKY